MVFDEMICEFFMRFNSDVDICPLNGRTVIPIYIALYLDVGKKRFLLNKSEAKKIRLLSNLIAKTFPYWLVLQAKQKRNNRKGKEKGREERSNLVVQDNHLQDDEKQDSIMEDVQPMVEKPDILDDVSDESDSVDGVPEVLQPDSDERDASPVNWDTDTSEVHPPMEVGSSGISSLSSVQNGVAERKSHSVMDDSSSTCSTDSVPSVVMVGPCKGNSIPNYKHQKSPSR